MNCIPIKLLRFEEDITVTIFKFIILSLTIPLLVSCSTSQSSASQTNQAAALQANTEISTNTSTAKLSAQGAEASSKSLEEYVPKVLEPKDIIPPMQSIKDLDTMIESYHLGQNLSSDQIINNKLLKQRIIRGTFDINELCRLSLGKHWPELDSAQQKHFVELMTKLLETKAIFSKEQLKGTNKYYTIKYKKEFFDTADKTKATVYTDMSVPKEKMTLNITYKMLLSPYGWKIFDVIVDDASLLTNYKFQFDRIILKNGFADLITRMEKKLDSIKGVKEETVTTEAQAKK
ncbi:MAG: ABC transporter substrate-binding protein [bacterium]|nr:ABC transporter substrate-binding protein [bacterium]